MKRFAKLLTLVGLLVTSSSLWGTGPQAPIIPPPAGVPIPQGISGVPFPVVQQGPVPAPFLYVTVKGPTSATTASTTTWYPGTSAQFTTQPESRLALRPGYQYRVELGNLAGFPGVKLYPSFEVRGTLHVPQGLDISKHPVPIEWNALDIQEALSGKLVTKIYYLENPDKALPLQAKPDEAIELIAYTENEAIDKSRDNGRPMLIVRLGERPYTPAELAASNIPGTVYVPGTSPVPTPAYPPAFPPTCIAYFDPVLGPKISNYECLHDGGDHQRKITIGNKQELLGLDPSDTAIEFKVKNRRKVESSNRVCLCVPRFIALKILTGPDGAFIVHGPKMDHNLLALHQAKVKQPVVIAGKSEQLVGVLGTQRASAQIGAQGPHAFGSNSKAMGVGVVQGIKIFSESREPEDMTFFPNCSLMLTKRVEPVNPERIGEVVTFTLRFYNPLAEAIEDVVISDSLTARLEYIAGSQQCDRPTSFSATPNEAGSVTLKWVLTDKLAPGQSGVIRFQAKIR